MPTLKIDGRDITVERGSTVLQAAQRLGIEIPTFCYHPGLSIAANCRMCLVQVKNSRKPLPACHALCADGMEVTTQGQAVVDTQKAILEFILLNHPVDCPICDQAGECVLQDHYHDYSLKYSRLEHTKVHKAKAKVLGPTVVLDAERCILCTRCVRFCDEVTKTNELSVMERGEHSEITTFPGKQLNNPYSLNVVDICPVGALTSRDFRFKRRVWFVQGTRTVCTECARGCNVRADVFDNKVERFTPNFNPKVNNWWICDEGRLSHQRWQSNRVEAASSRVGGEERAVTARDAADAMAEALMAAGKKSAVILSPQLTNEDAWAALAVAKAAGSALYLGGRTTRGYQDDLLIRADRNANRRGLEELTRGAELRTLADFVEAANKGQINAAVVFGSEHEWPAGAAAAWSKIATLGVVAELQTELVAAAHLVMPAAPPTMRSGTLVNFEGRVQRLVRAVRLDPPGVVFPHWRIAKRMLQTLGREWAVASEEDVFAEVASKVAAFAGMSWSSLGDYGLPLGGGGASDLDPAEVALKIDRSAPEWRKKNVNSRAPWQH
jgi:NADH-quinone oxidoreductase subunit G